MSKPISVKKVIAFGFLRLVIEYRGKRYAIVRHVRCNGDFKQNTPAAPPYVTKTIPVNWPFEIPEEELGRRTQALRETNKPQMLELQKRMMALCHQFGFMNFGLSVVPNQPTDYFVSPLSGIVGMPVIFELRVEAGFPRHTLADIFGRRGFIFVPLEFAHESDWPIPVYSNVSEMLRAWAEAGPLTTIKDSEFTIRSSGLVCSLDVNGYGQLLQSSQGNVTERKGLVQNTIRSEVIRLTSRLLWRLGLPPHQITGDGALFCLESERAELNKLCSAYVEEVCKPLEGWNEIIHRGDASGSAAGSRLVVVLDQFHFGRIAGAESIVPGIDGQSLIDVVRLDAGFKEHLKSIATRQEARHFFVSPDSLTHRELDPSNTSETFQYQTKENRALRGRYTPIVWTTT